MTRSTASLEALLRVGPTDSAAYVAPAFAVVVARRPRQRPKVIPFLRSFGELTAAAAVVVVVGSVFLLARLGGDGAGVSNLTAAAAAMGVPTTAVVDAGGAFVAPRWNDGRLELLLARSTANGWTSAVIGQIEAERPAGGGASDVATATCDGIDLRHPVFVYGQIVGWDFVPRTLALHGLVPTGGGELIDGSFVFAAAAAKAGTPFWISSPRAAGAPTPGLRASGDIPTTHPGSVFEGKTASPVRCAAG